MIIEKFTKALNNTNNKCTLLEKENLHLRDKITKSSAARKELLISIEEFKRNNQSDTLKYEKLLQQHEASKKMKDSEIKDAHESLQRCEALKKNYIEDLEAIEISLHNEKQAHAQLQVKYDEVLVSIEKMSITINSKDEEITKKKKKIEKLHEVKIKFSIAQKEIKAVRDENNRLEKLIETFKNKYTNEKDYWNREAESFQKKIQNLQEELNNEKTFNTIHLQEVMKLKRALSAKEVKASKDQISEEEKALKAKIAILEMDIAEEKEIIEKLEKSANYSNTQLLEKNKLINELESKIEEQ